MKGIGDKLKTLRQNAGLTQKQLGDILHVSYQAVSKWERNVGLPDPYLFPLIADALNTTVNELFYEGNESIASQSESSSRKRVRQSVETDKKSAYKPVNRKLLIIIAVAVICVIVLSCTLAFEGVKTQANKKELVFATQVFMQEDNVSLSANFNGQTYLYARKYFFDGRVLSYYNDGKSERYYYKEKVYTTKGESVNITETTYDDFLSELPPFCVFDVVNNDFKTFKKTESGYEIKLKSADNLPIAQRFGFSKDAKIKVSLDTGKIKTIVVSEGENVLTIDYLFGYSFNFALPSFIKA